MFVTAFNPFLSVLTAPFPLQLQLPCWSPSLILLPPNPSHQLLAGIPSTVPGPLLLLGSASGSGGQEQAGRRDAEEDEEEEASGQGRKVEPNEYAGERL